MSAFFTYVNYFWACSGSQLVLHNLISCDKGQYFNLGEKLHRSRKKRGGLRGGGVKGHLSRFRELQGLWNERGGEKRLPGVSVLLYCATICLRKQTALAPNSHDQRAATPALNNRAAAARVKTPVVGCDSARFAKCRARRGEDRWEDQMSALEPATKIEARCQRTAVQLKVPSDVKFNLPTL